MTLFKDDRHAFHKKAVSIDVDQLLDNGRHILGTDLGAESPDTFINPIISKLYSFYLAEGVGDLVFY